MKILGGGTAQNGMFMYSYMSHADICYNIISNSQFWIAWLHFEMLYKQKDLTDYEH